MSYANLIFKRIPFAALISDRGDWSSPLGWEKKIFGWIAVRRAIPAEKRRTHPNAIFGCENSFHFAGRHAPIYT